MKSLIIVIALLAMLTGAMAFNYGGDGSEFGHMGASVGAGTAAVNTCSSGSNMNGTFDLTNTCNDIYLLTGTI